MKFKFVRTFYVPAFDNDALIPEMWAQEALLNLENNLVITNLVHRDFEDEIQKEGDVVNAHRPDTRTPTRKVDGDTITSNATNSTNVPVTLNQHVYDSFIIYDGEESKSFKSLVNLHLVPAVKGMAQFIDQVVATQVYNFLGNSVGRLGQGVTQATIIAAREEMNKLGVPMGARNLVVTPAQEADLLDIERLTAADKVGDDGTALREASLGRLYGFNIFMDQNMPSVTNTTDPSGTMLINNAAGYSKGDTVLTVDGGVAAADCPVGSWVTVAADDTPQMVTAIVGDPVTQITVTPGLRRSVANNAVVSIYPDGAIDNAAGYAANWTKDITIDTITTAPVTGQLLSMDASTARYYAALNTPTTTSVLLSDALAAAVANNDVVGLGPNGEFGMAFHPQAVALVTRPLAMPRAETGVRGFVASYNGLSIRVVISYNAQKQGHVVTVDLLAGVAILDSNLGFPFLG